MDDFLTESTAWLERAGETAGMDAAVMDYLAAPQRTVHFRIPLRMDDGSRRIFNAYRVQHNDALGPSRDGTRISPDVNIDEVKALGLLMTVKHAAGLIPAGGGKGGVAADPKQLSDGEYERLCRAFLRGLKPRGPGFDVPGADIGTDLQAMAWMLDEYEQTAGVHAPAAINDKPAILGGSEGGYEATGAGVFDMAAEAAKDMGLQLEGARVAIQGFGQVGGIAAARFAEAGAKVVAISNARGGSFNGDGLDVEAMLEHCGKRSPLGDFAGGEAIDNDQLLACDCDILVPAAVQGVLTEANAGDVRAKLLVEAANGPTTAAADRVLAGNGVTIVPDVLANSGSVHVCQMERSQGLADDYWALETVDRRRRERMVAAYRAAVHTAADHGVESLRLGAWINAIERVAEAMRLRGWV